MIIYIYADHSKIDGLWIMEIKKRMAGSATLSMYMHGKRRTRMNDGAISVMKGAMG